MKNVMIDFETLSTKPNAAVVSIGAVEFDFDTMTTGKDLLLYIDIGEYISYKKFDIDPNTLKWWFNQPSATIDNTFNSFKKYSIKRAFSLLNEFINYRDLWCHANFDYPVLDHAINYLKIDRNYNYWNCRDIRTIVGLAGYDYRNHPRKNNNIHHTAIGDCYHQIDYILECNRILKGGV